MTYCLNSKSIQDVPVARIQFILHFLKQRTALLTKSCENEINTVLCLFYRSSAGVPWTRRIWRYWRTRPNAERQKKRGKQQSVKSENVFRNILVPLWPHIEGALSITMKKFKFFVVTMPLFTFFYYQRKVISYRRNLCEAARKLDCYREMVLKDDWEPTENKRRVHSIIIFALYREQR